MLDVEVSLLAVILSAVASMALGFLWYGPFFGKPWMKLIGLSEAKLEEMKKKGMGKTYALSLLASFIMAYVVGVFVNLAGVETIFEGAMIGFWIWLGFAATIQLNEVLYNNAPWNLYYINTGYQLALFLIMGGIHALLG